MDDKASPAAEWAQPWLASMWNRQRADEMHLPIVACRVFKHLVKRVVFLDVFSIFPMMTVISSS